MDAQAVTIPDPATALAVFFVLALAAGVIFWPRVGLLAWLGKVKRLTERVRLEDVLKQLYKLEYRRHSATVEAVAGGAQISRHQAMAALQRLEELEFVVPEAEEFGLTEAGRVYALRVLRTHRLWERFLADRTGVRPSRWHGLAEEREHMLSEEATEDLAASLGHPVYDPHGDPIPTAEGQMPARRGFPLAEARSGETLVITHLEDEPPAVYEQLVALGLGPTLPLDVLEAPAGRVRFRALGEEHEITALVARNVTVEAGVPTAALDTYETLSSLEPGESGRVVGISPTCQGPSRRRLLDLGVVPGTVITARLRSATRDPVAYDIRGALIALRAEQASVIQIDRSDLQEAV